MQQVIMGLLRFTTYFRNYGVLTDTEVKVEMKALKHQRSEFIMRVGKHEARVREKNCMHIYTGR